MASRQYGVGDATAFGCLFEDIIALEMELAKGNFLTVSIVVKEGQFDKMFDLSSFAFLKKSHKGFNVIFHVREGTKDRLDPNQRLVLGFLVGPIKIHNFGTFVFQKFGNVVCKRVFISGGGRSVSDFTFSSVDTNLYVVTSYHPTKETRPRHKSKGKERKPIKEKIQRNKLVLVSDDYRTHCNMMIILQFIDCPKTTQSTKKEKKKKTFVRFIHTHPDILLS
jgi:hypothetical protein